MLSGLLLTIMSWFIGYTWDDLTGKVQEQYVVERYFERVEEQSPIVYRLWRILWQKFEWVIWWNLTNRSDCGWMIVWYMMELWLIKSRWKDFEWDSFTYDWWWLNSFRLYTLWKSKQRKDVVRGDYIYMKFDNWNHIAIACNTGATMIYDLYKKPYAECRPRPYPNKALFASNGIVNFLDDYNIVLDETNEIIINLMDTRSKILLNNIMNDFSMIDGLYSTGLIKELQLMSETIGNI